MQNQLRSKWSYRRNHHNFLKACPICNNRVLIILNTSVLKWCIAGSEPQLLYKSDHFRFGSRMRQDLSQACYWSLKTFLVGSCCRYGLHGWGTLSVAHFDTSWVRVSCTQYYIFLYCRWIILSTSCAEWIFDLVFNDVLNSRLLLNKACNGFNVTDPAVHRVNKLIVRKAITLFTDFTACNRIKQNPLDRATSFFNTSHPLNKSTCGLYISNSWISQITPHRD